MVMRQKLQRTDEAAELFGELYIFRIINGAVDDCRSLLSKGIFYHWKQIIFCGHSVSQGAEGLCKFHKIRVVEFCEELAVVPESFFPFDKAVSSIVEYDADKIDAESHSGIDLAY